LVARRERAEAKGAAHVLAEIEAELQLPPFPDELFYLWQTYLRLRRRAPAGFAGPQPVGWQDIDAFTRLSGVRLAPWEIGVVEALDEIYLRPASKPGPPSGQAARVSAASSDGAGVRAILGGIGKRRVFKRTKGEASG
jgi:hypothetical protein